MRHQSRRLPGHADEYYLCLATLKHAVPNDLSLDVGKERLATRAGHKSLHVVRAEVVQKRLPIRPVTEILDQSVNSTTARPDLSA